MIWFVMLIQNLHNNYSSTGFTGRGGVQVPLVGVLGLPRSPH